MKNTKKWFIILTVVFLLVGLGTLTATELDNNDISGLTKKANITKTSTITKDTVSVKKVTTQKNLSKEKVVETYSNLNTNKTIIKQDKTNNIKTAYTYVKINTSSQLNSFLTSNRNESLWLSIENDITITATSTLNPEIKNLRIDGNYNKVLYGQQNVRRHFLLVNYANVELINFNAHNVQGSVVITNGTITIRNSTFNNCYNGDTIYVNGQNTPGGCTVYVNNSRFINCKAQYGTDHHAPLNLYRCSAVIGNSTFENNNGKDGAAINWASELSYDTGRTCLISNNKFINNQAGHCGGAIRSDGTITIKDNVFTNNSAGRGGVIAHYGGSINIERNNFTNNKINRDIIGTDSMGNGGGVVYISSYHRKSTGTINNNQIRNTDSSVDFVYGLILSLNSVDSFQVNNNLIRDNTGNSYADSLIRIIDSNLTLIENNITNNKAGYQNVMSIIRGNVKLNKNNITKNVANAGNIISTSGKTEITNNNITDNVVLNTANWIIQNSGTLEFLNNFCKNNTDNRRDMLLSNSTVPSKIYGNTYFDNYLETSMPSISPITTYNNNDTKVNVNVNLRSVYNDTVRNGTVRVYVNGAYVNTATVTNGVAPITIPYNKLTSASNTVTLNYVSLSKHYQNKDASFTVNRRWNTKIEIQMPTGTTIYDSTKSFKFTLKDVNNNVLSNKVLRVTIDGKSYTPTTNVSGVATVDHKFTNVGNNRGVSVSFSAVTPYLASSNSTSINVVKRNTSITIVAPSSVDFNETRTISFNLKSDDGTELSGQQLNVKIGENTYTPNTNSYGVATVSYKFTKAGQTNITANYGGNTYYNPSNKTASTSVSKEPTTIIGINKSSVINETVLVEVKVVDSKNNIVRSGLVRVYEENMFLGTIDLSVSNSTTLIFNNVRVHELDLQYLDTDLYSGSSGKCFVNVNKLNSTIKVTTLNQVYLDETSNITVELTDNNGQVIKDRTVRIKIGDHYQSLTTGSNGRGSFEYTFHNTGSVPVTATFEGDDYFNPNETITSVNVVKKESMISIVPLNSNLGESSVEITLTDKQTGAPLTYRNVVITLPSMDIPVSTDHNGKRVVPVNLPVGEHAINATFNGDHTYNSSNNSTIINITARTTRISGTTVNGIVNGTISTVITVTNANNQRITTGPVEVLYNGNVIGIVDLSTSNTVNLTPFTQRGNYTLELRYLGDDQNSPSNGNIIANIDKLGTTLTLTVIDKNIAPGDMTNILVQLIDQNGKPVINELVTLYENGQILTTTRTNNTGGISYQYTPQTSGTKTITADCDLEDNLYYHTPPDVRETVEVDRIQTHFHIYSDNFEIGTPGNIIIELHDLNHSNLSNKPVSVIITEGENIKINDTFTTDSNGRINITYTPYGIVHVEANFAGDNRYRPVSGEEDIDPSKKPVFISIDASNTIINKTNTIKINVRDKNNDAINGSFLLYVDNNYIGNFRTNNGEYIYTDYYSREYRTEVPVRVEFIEEGYANTKETDTFKVGKIPTSTTINILNNTVINTTLEVHVTSEISQVRTGEVIITHRGVQIGSGQVQNGTARITLQLTAGVYDLVATYLENDYFLLSQNNTGDFQVIKLPTNTTAKVMNNTVGNVTLDIKVTSTGGIVADGYVDVFANGTNVGNGRISNGEVTITTNIARKGNYTFLVKYRGTDIYLESENSTISDVDGIPKEDIPVMGKISNLQATPYNTIYKNSSVNITLTDPETKEPLTRQPVLIINNDGDIVGTGITDDSGKAIIPVNIPVGTNYLTAIYEGNDEYRNSTAPVVITIQKIPTNTTATKPTTTPAGSPVIISVKVIENTTGNDVNSGTVTIYHETLIVGSAPVRIDGTSDIQIRNLKAGTYNLTIEYSGTEIYLKSSTRLDNVEITKQNATINAKPENTLIGNSSINVTLKDKDTNEPISYATINITLPNGTNVTGETNENGITIIKVDLPVGYHSLLPVTFIGNEQYNPVSTYVSILINKIPTTVTAKVENNTAGYFVIKANVTETQTGEAVTSGYVIIMDTEGIIFSDEIEVNNEGIAILPTNIEMPGKDDLVIKYLGTTDKYMANETTLYDVEIAKRPSVVTGTPNNQTFKNTDIDVDLKDKKTGRIISNATITVYDKNGEIVGNGTTNTDGKVRIRVNVPIGEQDVTVEFAGDETYDKSTDNVHLNIQKLGTTVTSMPARGKINATIPVTIVVTDDMGGNVTNGIVEVISQDGKFLGNVDLSQTNIINVQFDEGKQQNITLNYMGNTNLTESTGMGHVIVDKYDTKLTITPINVLHPGDVVEINVTLVDENNKTVSGELVKIAVEGNIVYTARTDNNGTIRYNYTSNTIGSVNIAAKYDGENSKIYNSAQDVEINVESRRIQTSLEIRAPILVANDENIINITLLDEYGNVLPGKEVEVIIKEPNMKQKTIIGRTNNQGILQVTYTPTKTNNITVSADFYGDDRYKESGANVTLDANAVSTKLTIMADNTIINETNTISIKLTDKNNNPLNGEVVLDIGGVRVPITVNNGVATYTQYSSPYNDHINVTALYSGTTGYGLSSARTSFYVDRRPTQTNGTFINKTAGNVQLEVTVTDKLNQNPVNGGTVKLTHNEEVIANGTIVNGKSIIKLPIDTPGDYNIGIIYEGNEFYHISENNTGAEVERIPTQTIAVLTENIAGNVIFEVGVITEDGVVPEGKVIIKSEGEKIAEGEVVNGIVKIQSTIPEYMGNYTFTAEYQGTDLYLPSSTTVEDTIGGRPSRILATQTNTTLGNTTVKINLTDPTTGEPLGHEPIEIYDENGNKIGNGTTTPEGTVEIRVDLPVGEHPVTVVFNGSPTHKASQRNITLNVNKKPSETTATRPEKETIGDILIPVTIIDPATGRPITNGNITITLPNGRPVGQATITTTTTQVPINLTNPGVYNLTIRYSGNDEYLPSRTVMDDVTVRKIATNIEVEQKDDVIIGTLLDEEGNPLKDTEVIITLPNGTQEVITTDPNGTFNLTTDLPPGDYNITIEYPGDETHDPSRKIVPITIPPIPTEIDATSNNKTPTDTQIDVKLKDKDGKPIPNAPFTVTLPNGTKINATTDKNGEAEVPVNLPVGKHTIQIDYPGNRTYEASTTQVPVTINKMPTNTTINIEGNKVGKVRVTGNVTDKDQKAVTSGTVQIRNGNNILGSATITNGEYNILTNITLEGTYELTAQYLGTDYYLASNSQTKTVKVEKLNSSITAKPEGNTPDNNNVTIELKDPETGKAIPNAPITITLPNGTKIPTTTDNNGKANVPLNLPEGNHNIIVDYPGNDTYKPSTKPVSITVTKKTPIMNSTPNGNKVGKTNITTTLKDPETGKAIPNAPVRIVVNGTVIANGTTDENGRVNIPVTLQEGNHTVTVVYPGNNIYKPVNNTVKINNISKNDPVIKLNPVRGVIGEDITLTAYLTDEDGTPISGGNLAFKLNGKTLRNDGRFDSNAPALKLSVKNGLVTITLKADLYLRNAKNLTAAYSGNNKYKETSSPTVEAQIQKRYAGVTVTATPTWNKQYDTITFKATVKDVTKNGKNNTLINQNTKVMFKVNGNTLRDNKGQIIYAQVQKDLTATYKYTVPAGTGGITASKAPRDYKVEAIFVGDNYYPGARNNTKFNVERSPITVNINSASVTKLNTLSVKGTIKDYKGNNVLGTNKITIKINGKSYTDSKGKPVYWSIKNGNIDLKNIQVDSKTTIKRVMIVTGDRQAYLEGRNETTNIIRV